MKRPIKHRFAPLLPLFVIAATLSPHAFGEVFYETITFLDKDGYHFLNYATTRSDADSYTVFTDKSEDQSNFVYVSPGEYDFDDLSDSDANLLLFDEGSYALMSEGDYLMTGLAEQDADGVYTLRSWDGQVRDDGHFGYWNAPDPFTHFAATWVIPSEIELLDYEANQDGRWIERDGAITFIGTNSNDLAFTLRYQHKVTDQYAELSEELEAFDEVEVDKRGDALLLTVTNEILFASGSAALSQEGRALIANLAAQLSQDYAIIVAGHTDDVPIRGALKTRYLTNWELSAARAMNVVHVLTASGVNPQVLEVRAYGSQQPRVPNEDADSRQANRRIELLIQPKAIAANL